MEWSRKRSHLLSKLLDKYFAFLLVLRSLVDKKYLTTMLDFLYLLEHVSELNMRGISKEKISVDYKWLFLIFCLHTLGDYTKVRFRKQTLGG